MLLEFGPSDTSPFNLHEHFPVWPNDSGLIYLKLRSLLYPRQINSWTIWGGLEGWQA